MDIYCVKFPHKMQYFHLPRRFKKIFVACPVILKSLPKLILGYLKNLCILIMRRNRKIFTGVIQIYQKIFYLWNRTQKNNEARNVRFWNNQPRLIAQLCLASEERSARQLIRRKKCFLIFAHLMSELFSSLDGLWISPTAWEKTMV